MKNANASNNLSAFYSMGAGNPVVVAPPTTTPPSTSAVMLLRQGKLLSQGQIIRQ